MNYTKDKDALILIGAGLLVYYGADKIKETVTEVIPSFTIPDVITPVSNVVNAATTTAQDTLKGVITNVTDTAQQIQLGAAYSTFGAYMTLAKPIIEMIPETPENIIMVNQQLYNTQRLLYGTIVNSWDFGEDINKW